MQQKVEALTLVEQKRLISLIAKTFIIEVGVLYQPLGIP
jgi:hypothetical protein